MEALRLMSSFGLAPRGIVHIGANDGQEFEAYLASGAETDRHLDEVEIYARPTS